MSVETGLTYSEGDMEEMAEALSVARGEVAVLREALERIAGLWDTDNVGDLEWKELWDRTVWVAKDALSALASSPPGGPE